MKNQKPLILVVDDIEANRYYFAKVLKEAGYDVVEAASGAESLLKLEPTPDLIILDINLPDINGFEICRQLKQSHLKKIPVIQTSASFTAQEHFEKGMGSGADAYLTDPVNPEHLLSIVKKSLKDS